MRTNSRDYQGQKKTDKRLVIVPAPEVKSEEPDKYRADQKNNRPNLSNIDDEKVIPGLALRRRSWNSVDFEGTDFLGI